MADFKIDQNPPVPNLITVTIRSTKKRKDVSIEDNNRIYEVFNIYDRFVENFCYLGNNEYASF